MAKNNTLYLVAFVLVIIGGINWGLFGLFGLDLVDVLFAGIPTVAEIIYTLIGISAVYLAVVYAKNSKK